MNNVEIVAERPVGWLNGRVRVAVGKVDGFRVELDTADRTDQILALPLAFFDRLVQFAQRVAAEYHGRRPCCQL